MKPVVKYIYSADIDNVESYYPTEEKFCIHFRAIIGPDNGDESEESIDFEICSTKWLEYECHSWGITSGSDRLFVLNYDYSVIKKKITSLVESCEGENWEHCCRQIVKFGLWEFENYRE